jgi:hypothetical protein
LKKRAPPGVISTTSPSAGKTARSVSLRNAATFDARKFSPSPSPTTSGVCCRTPASRSGLSWWIATIVKWPSSRG